MSSAFGYGRGGRLYRYYVSAPLQQGRSSPQSADAIRRIPAEAIEGLVRDRLVGLARAKADAALGDLIGAIRRVDIDATSVRIMLTRSSLATSAAEALEPHPEERNLAVLHLPISCRFRGGRTWILCPPGSDAKAHGRRDPVLIRALRQSHKLAVGMGWRCFDGAVENASGKAPANAYERRLCRLAFLAPDLQRRIMEGRQPTALNLERLIHEPIPVSWTEQRGLYCET